MSIPRIIHRIWIGSAPNDQQIATLLDARLHIQGRVELWLWTTRSNRPRLPFTIDKNIVLRDLDTLWTESSIPSVPLAYLHSAFERERYGYYHNYAAASDIARLLILYRHGGVYLDMDVSFREGAFDLFGDLRNIGQRLGMLGRHGHELMNAVLAAMPRAKAPEKCLASIACSYKQNPYSWDDKRGFLAPQFFRVGMTLGMTGPGMIHKILIQEGMLQGIPHHYFEQPDASGTSFTTRPKIKRRDSLP